MISDSSNTQVLKFKSVQQQCQSFCNLLIQWLSHDKFKIENYFGLDHYIELTILSLCKNFQDSLPFSYITVTDYFQRKSHFIKSLLMEREISAFSTLKTNHQASRTCKMKKQLQKINVKVKALMQFLIYK